MRNWQYQTPEVGDALRWACETEHHISAVDTETITVTYADESFVYMRNRLGIAFELVKADPTFHVRITPQAQIVLTHIQRAGSITQREAVVDYSVQSLTRRITELRDAGFGIERELRFHPITGQRYARYSLA